MNRKLKGCIAGIVYGIIILCIYCMAESNMGFHLFFFMPYVLGGCSFIGFFAGRIIQKQGGTRSVCGWLGYMALAGVFTFAGCCWLYSNGLEYSVTGVFREDTYVVLCLTMLGVFLGEVYQYMSNNKTESRRRGK